MADGDDQNDDVLDDDVDDVADDDAGDSGDDSGGDSAKEDKRVADLIAARDKEAARANKAEKALRAAADAGTDKGSNDPGQQALMAELREASLDAVFGKYPELKDYDIDRSLIEGTTRAELTAGAEALVSLIKKVSTKARNKALADAGVEAPTSGASRKPPVDYGAMSDEEFLKHLDGM